MASRLSFHGLLSRHLHSSARAARQRTADGLAGVSIRSWLPPRPAGWKPEVRASAGLVSPEASPPPCLSTVSSHGHPSVCPVSSSLQDASHIGVGPILTIPLYLSHTSRDPVSENGLILRCWQSGFWHMNLGDTQQHPSWPPTLPTHHQPAARAPPLLWPLPPLPGLSAPPRLTFDSRKLPPRVLVSPTWLSDCETLLVRAGPCPSLSRTPAHGTCGAALPAPHIIVGGEPGSDRSNTLPKVTELIVGGPGVEPSLPAPGWNPAFQLQGRLSEHGVCPQMPRTHPQQGGGWGRQTDRHV